MTRKLTLCVVLGLALALAGCARNRAAPASESAESTQATSESSETTSAPSNPSQEVTLVTPIPFAAPVRDAIKDECRLRPKLEQFIKEYGASADIAVATSQEAPEQIPGRVLVVRITDVYAPGGGAFSGGKAVTIEGELLEDGQRIGSLRARRLSGGGAFAAFKSTCDILGRDVKTLGSDVSNFLLDPKEGVRMGNL